MVDALIIIFIGAFAGVVAGMLGVGGGVFFVVALTLFFGLSQVEAVATSLLAIIPVGLVGVWRQRVYDNVRLHEGLVLGVLAIGGSALGVVIANTVSGDVLRLSFAGLLLVVAFQLIRRVIRPVKRA